jgi:hypothetical protein
MTEEGMFDLAADPEEPEDMVAKKNHVICQNEYYFDIKKGDDLSDIPERFHQVLKTEQVI